MGDRVPRKTASTMGESALSTNGRQGASCPADGHAEDPSQVVPTFRHDALLYDSPDELAAVAVPFLLEGLAAHPHLVSRSGRVANREFIDPAAYLGTLPVPDEPLERTAPALVFDDVTDFIGLRRTVRARLRSLDGPADLIEDYLLAVDEMTSNATLHGRRPVGVRLWSTPGRLVCTIRDAGDGPTDPFAGYGPAHGEDLSAGGMGLWLARQLCDHVALRRDAHGNSIRLSVGW
ncbi:ATP-binding protein [uncultured Modestobacter sp.]|uniref:ATP-binding protein n=1 Tax=uncultured Modestobacter sp. TaxID=380048 RepID=UPI0026225AEE|nr:ATP-binding protein [uncultured Modestobacter sp.]